MTMTVIVPVLLLLPRSAPIAACPIGWHLVEWLYPLMICWPD